MDGTRTQVLRWSTAKVISARISIHPKIKAFLIFFPVSVSFFVCFLNPQKDVRSRSVRLQRGTAHIQRSTERRVSVVVGRTWLRLWPSGTAATDTPRLASSRYRLARLRADRTLTVHLCLILLETIFFFFFF